MNKLDRYISSSVLSAMFFVMLVVVGLDIIFSLVDELKKLQGNYQILQALEFVVMRVPRRVNEYLSLTAMIGCVVGLGSLASSSELIVMRAAGIPVNRIVISVLKPAVFLAIFGLILAEFVVPPLEKVAQSFRSVSQASGQTTFSKALQGYWHREGDSFMRFNAVEPNGVLHGVTRFEFEGRYSEKESNRQVKKIIYAKRGIYQKDHWVLEDISTTFFDGDRTYQTKEKSQYWYTKLSPEELSVVVVKPKNLSISGLYAYAHYLDQQGLNSDTYFLSFWRKVFQPLGIIALVVIGISFVFGPLRSVTMGYRIFMGVIVGLAYKYSEELLGPASIVFGFHPVLASIIPIIFCVLIGGFMLRKVG